MAELILGQPLFLGESCVDQLVEIIKILGTPTKEQILSMNEHYSEYKFPQIKSCSWSKVKYQRKIFNIKNEIDIFQLFIYFIY